MKIIHIKNLFNTIGSADYRGLDLTKIVPGSQMYPPDKNEAYLFYDGTVTSKGDLLVIDQVTYDAEAARIDSLPRPVTDTERIAGLEEMVAGLLMGGGLGV